MYGMCGGWADTSNSANEDRPRQRFQTEDDIHGLRGVAPGTISAGRSNRDLDTTGALPIKRDSKGSDSQYTRVRNAALHHVVWRNLNYLEQLAVTHAMA